MHKDHKKTLNFLTYICKFSPRSAHKIIADYGKTIMNKEKANLKFFTAEERNQLRNVYYREVCIHIQANWQTFMDLYGTVKDKYRKQQVKQ